MHRRLPFPSRLTLLPGLLLLAAPVAAQSNTPRLDDPTIVAIFDAANTADIETGRLAAQQGQDPKVREFGAMIAHDHEALRQQGRNLAKRLGVTPTPPSDPSGQRAQQQAMRELRAARGADFDRLFLHHEVAFHQQVIRDVQQTLLPAIKNAELKAFVVKVAPAFQGHLLAAQQLERATTGEHASAAGGSRP